MCHSASMGLKYPQWNSHPLNDLIHKLRSMLCEHFHVALWANNSIELQYIIKSVEVYKYDSG